MSSVLHVPPANPQSPPKSILKKGNEHRKSINDVKLVLDGHVPEAEEDDNSPRHAKTKMFVEGKEGVVKKGEKKLHPASPRQNNDAISSEQGSDSDSDTDSEPIPEETVTSRSVSQQKGAIQPRKTSTANSSTSSLTSASTASSSTSSPASTSAAASKESSSSSKKEGGIFSKVFKKTGSSAKSKDKK
eukprot:TRINITY_DN2151_c0_g1_i1.p1 TRINITY_DN2151_c0_g1~~TRINITY_DN2151_c0_g1_i1.p1  ORF type:complete len:188 (+),score=67.48 TRINITY_DN2151_c0_g1_i1:281-844(+)